MDVLLGSAPLRPHNRHRALTSSSHLLTSSNHLQTSSIDGWAESIDLLRVAHPDYSPSSPALLPSSSSSSSSPTAYSGTTTQTRPTPVSSTLCTSSRSSDVSEVKPEVVCMVTSTIGPRIPLTDPPPPAPSACRACCEQDEGRHPVGVYYHPYPHHHPNPYCRVCQAAPGSTTNPDDASLHFNYRKYPAGQTPLGVRTPHCSPYSTSPLFSQQPYARVSTPKGQGSGEGGGTSGTGVGYSGQGQRSEARINTRRRFLRFAPDLWQRFLRSSSGSGAPGTCASKPSRTGTSMVDPSVVETKAEASVDGSGKTGKGIAKKNRGAGEGDYKSYKSQRMVVVGAFLLAAFVMTAASVLGIVLLWTPLNGTVSASSSSLATDLARSQNAINSNHVTEDDNDVVRYITVIPSLIKATADDVGWAFYARGSAKGSKYTVINKPMTFYSAQEHCQKLGGYLVHINTLREQLFLEDFLTQELEKQGPSQDSGIGFWIGAKRARGSHEGTCMFEQWKWVDSYGRALSAIAGLTAFIPGKPDNQYNPEECLFLSYKERADENRFLKWDDAPCDLNSIGAIKALCEVEIR